MIQADGRAVPSCGYRAQDIIDDDIGDIDDPVSELSKAFNNPSAEGFMSTIDNFPKFIRCFENL